MRSAIYVVALRLILVGRSFRSFIERSQIRKICWWRDPESARVWPIQRLDYLYFGMLWRAVPHPESEAAQTCPALRLRSGTA